jgi:hypothetical protein
MRFTNDQPGVSVTVSNVIRNICLHFSGYPLVVRFVYDVHRMLGINPEDPATTWTGTRFDVLPWYCTRHEACASSPIHVILLLLAIPIVCWLFVYNNERGLFFYCAGIAASFVLFCAAFRWQPWHTRLHLSMLVPGTVVIGILLTRVRFPKLKMIVCMLLLVPAQFFVYRSYNHPLIGRSSVLTNDRLHQYFYDSRNDESSYRRAVDYVRSSGCSQIGIDNSSDATRPPPRLPPMEYPLLALFREKVPDAQFIHVGVNDSSAAYSDRAPFVTPCAVVCLTCAADRRKWEQLRSNIEPVVFDPLVVFLRSSRD